MWKTLACPSLVIFVQTGKSLRVFLHSVKSRFGQDATMHDGICNSKTQGFGSTLWYRGVKAGSRMRFHGPAIGLFARGPGLHRWYIDGSAELGFFNLQSENWILVPSTANRCLHRLYSWNKTGGQTAYPTEHILITQGSWLHRNTSIIHLLRLVNAWKHMIFSLAGTIAGRKQFVYIALHCGVTCSRQCPSSNIFGNVCLRLWRTWGYSGLPRVSIVITVSLCGVHLAPLISTWRSPRALLQSLDADTLSSRPARRLLQSLVE